MLQEPSRDSVCGAADRRVVPILIVADQPLLVTELRDRGRGAGQARPLAVGPLKPQQMAEIDRILGR